MIIPRAKGGQTPATLADLAFHVAAAGHGRPRLVAGKRDGDWRWWSAEEWLEGIHHLAGALEQRGVAKGDRIAILAANCPEWHLVDFACHLLGAIVVPIYITLPPDQIAFIVEDSGSRWIFYRGEEQAEALRRTRPLLTGAIDGVAITGERAAEKDVAFEALLSEGARAAGERPLDGFRGRVDLEDLASLIYTSGTTGPPKGVMLTHRNLVSNFLACADAFPIGSDDVTLSFLPLSHVFQRLADYLFLYKGVSIQYLTSIEQAPRALTEVRPTILASVPRLYERAYLRVIENVRKEPARLQKVFRWAADVGERCTEGGELRVPARLTLQYTVASRLVFKKIRDRFGGRLRFAIAGGAALPEKIGRFFAAVGIGIYEGYGLTETSPVLCLNRPGKSHFGAVGTPIPGVELRIADDGEILARSPGLMRGYWNQPEATAEAIDPDGWFHTGDVGHLDREGFLHITDRKKDLIVTSGGKNIAPQPIEQLLTASGVLAQAIVIGDNYPYLTALLVPSSEDLPEEVHQLTPAERVSHPALLDRVEATVADVNRKLAEHDRIRRFRLMDHEFTLERGEMTPTLKLRRKLILERYADLVASMYLKSQRLER
ncbi:MAG TPA: long-chain fatty acid--CoA ligase [Thermoanaerobaculia bacterium]|nr:long-chain fatty acid--CoA ligase [Thermoanaerobaculia bacterium]